MQSNQQYKRNCPNLAADAVVIQNNQILMITRGKEPNKGTFALPGGHVDVGEDPEQGVLRELEEECGLKGTGVELLGVRGGPNRDPRYHTVSIIYKVTLQDPNQQPIQGDDAATAKFYDISDVKKYTKEQFFSDHYEIINEAFQKYNL